MTQPAGDPGHPPDPGRRLADEALRLVEALRDAGAGPDTGERGHLGADCRVCPLCRALATVRAVRPEAVEHLALAAAELVRAWREVVATDPPAAPAPGPGRDAPTVERIDVTD